MWNRWQNLIKLGGLTYMLTFYITRNVTQVKLQVVGPNCTQVHAFAWRFWTKVEKWDSFCQVWKYDKEIQQSKHPIAAIYVEQQQEDNNE